MTNSGRTWGGKSLVRPVPISPMDEPGGRDVGLVRPSPQLAELEQASEMFDESSDGVVDGVSPIERDGLRLSV